MVDRGHIDQQVNIHFEEEDESVTINAPVRRGVMPSSFEPTEWSVICGRGRDCYDHVGNRRLRVLVEEKLDQYAATRSKFQKTLLVTAIIDAVRETNHKGGAFVRKDAKSGRWVEIGDDATREKIGQMLREALIRKCPQKLEAKKKKRREKTRRSSANSTGGMASAARAVQAAESTILAEASKNSAGTSYSDPIAKSLANQMVPPRPVMPSLPQAGASLTFPASATNQFLDARQQADPQYVQQERLLVASRLLNWDLEPVSLQEQLGQGSIASRAAVQNGNFAAMGAGHNGNFHSAQMMLQQQRQQQLQRQQLLHQEQRQQQRQQLLMQEQQRQQMLQQEQEQQFQQESQDQQDLPPMVWPWMEPGSN